MESYYLENESIKERYAEVLSQYEPLIKVTNGDDKLRKGIDRILKYVVFGQILTEIKGEWWKHLKLKYIVV